ncbi:hypothetical protein BHM03_00051681 [Ensete ventricosum]|nr:hypothetical protein BHM03_00051681 [Ensete ventricosum]
MEDGWGGRSTCSAPSLSSALVAVEMGGEIASSGLRWWWSTLRRPGKGGDAGNPRAAASLVGALLATITTRRRPCRAAAPLRIEISHARLRFDSTSHALASETKERSTDGRMGFFCTHLMRRRIVVAFVECENIKRARPRKSHVIGEGRAPLPRGARCGGIGGADHLMFRFGTPASASSGLCHLNRLTPMLYHRPETGGGAVVGFARGEATMANEITMVSRQRDDGGEPGGGTRPEQMTTGMEHGHVFLSRLKQETGLLTAPHTRSIRNPAHPGAVDWCILV